MEDMGSFEKLSLKRLQDCRKDSHSANKCSESFLIYTSISRKLKFFQVTQNYLSQKQYLLQSSVQFLEYYLNLKPANGLRKQGIYIQKNGSRWELDYSYNKNGQVIQTWRNNATLVGNYKGFMKNDRKQGKGTFDWVNGNSYEGEWRNDKFEGHGTFIHANGDMYEGDWKNGKREGNGTFYWADKRKWMGEFKNDQPHGKGVYSLKDGNQYLDYWQNGERITSNKI